MELFSFCQVAEKLGVPHTTLYYHTITGKVPPPTRINKARVYTPEDVEMLRQYFFARGYSRKKVEV